MHTNRIVPRVRTAIVGGGPSTSSLLANVIHPRHDRKPSDCDFNVVRLHPNDSMWKNFQATSRWANPLSCWSPRPTSAISRTSAS